MSGSGMKQEPTIVLETSAAIAYLVNEPEWEDIERLLALAEAARIQLVMSEFAWSEIKPGHKHRRDRLERLQNVAQPIPKVARVGEWRVGLDMLAHDASNEIETSFPRKAGREDREQFLSYAARATASYFVTKDKDFLKGSMRTSVHKRFGFQVGQPKSCLESLKEEGIV